MSYAYDALGNLTTQTDPLGAETAYTCTVESLLEKVTYANGATQSLGYDLVGNVVSETDGEGKDSSKVQQFFHGSIFLFCAVK